MSQDPVGRVGEPLRRGTTLRRALASPDPYEDHVRSVAGRAVSLRTQVLGHRAGIGRDRRTDPHGGVEPLGDPNGRHRGHADDGEPDGSARVAGDVTEIDGVADPLMELRHRRRTQDDLVRCRQRPTRGDGWSDRGARVGQQAGDLDPVELHGGEPDARRRNPGVVPERGQRRVRDRPVPIGTLYRVVPIPAIEGRMGHQCVQARAEGQRSGQDDHRDHGRKDGPAEVTGCPSVAWVDRKGGACHGRRGQAALGYEPHGGRTVSTGTGASTPLGAMRRPEERHEHGRCADDDGHHGEPGAKHGPVRVHTPVGVDVAHGPDREEG